MRTFGQVFRTMDGDGPWAGARESGMRIEWTGKGEENKRKLCGSQEAAAAAGRWPPIPLPQWGRSRAANSSRSFSRLGQSLFWCLPLLPPPLLLHCIGWNALSPPPIIRSLKKQQLMRVWGFSFRINPFALFAKIEICLGDKRARRMRGWGITYASLFAETLVGDMENLKERESRLVHLEWNLEKQY